MSDWRTILAIDHDPKACEVYRANFPGVRVECGEVKDFDPRLGADVILGGPPCQPFSHAGKREGDEDARDCVPDFIAAVATGQPRMFLMEQVSGFLTFDGGRYMQRTVMALERAGYVVEMRVLDAADFGVPQFRVRCWFWGIRRDVYEGGVRHRWPTRTHMDPAQRGGMFGEDLPAWVTVGQALGLDGVYDAQNDAARGADEPCGTIQGNAQAKGGGAGHYAIQSHADPARPIDEPASTLMSGGAGHDGCCVRVQEYRWSDAMLVKHPPASPAPTVQAKWFKGGAEGLVAIRRPRSFKGAGGCIRRDHPVSEPSPLVDGRHGGSGLHGIIRTKQKRTTRTTREPAGTLAGDSRHQLAVRRLTPDECARLQSMPDDFVWPASIAKTHRYRIIGNGWASLMAWHMSRALKAADPQSETAIDLFCGGGCGAVGWHGRAWEYEATKARTAGGCDGE